MMLRLTSLLAAFLLLLIVSANAAEYTGTVTGHVVSAQNVNQNLDGVIVTNDRTSATTVVQNGIYSQTLPIGDVTLGFTDESGEFVKVRRAVTVPINSTLECNVAMIPEYVDPPASVIMTPINPIVLVDEIKSFEGHCYGANGVPVSLSPVWSLVEGPDSDALDWATGILAPSQTGRYIIEASVGELNITHRINVTDGPRPRCLYAGLEDDIEDFLIEMGYSVDRMQSLPPSLDAYDVTVLDNINAVSVQDSDKLRDYLEQGGGVVIVGAALWGLTTPTWRSTWHSFDDISDWFGMSGTHTWNAEGVVCMGDLDKVYIKINRPFGLDFAEEELLFKTNEELYIISRKAQPDEFIVRMAGVYSEYYFAITHTYGYGRVYFQGNILGSPNYPWVIQLFGGGVNWAAGRI